MKLKYSWDEWRAKYHTLTTEEQIAFHDEIEVVYPDQKHFDLETARQAVGIAMPEFIIEIGGWKGDLAKIILSENPLIKRWHNIELSSAAIAKSVCTDHRYKVYQPVRFDWFKPEPFAEANLVLATHFIEHLSNDHFDKLAESLQGVPFIYFEAPITDEGNGWDGFEGTHKLEYGWNVVKERFPDHRLLIDKPSCKLFAK